MSKLPVTAHLTYLHPSVVLKFPDDLPDFHRAKLLTGCIGSADVPPALRAGVMG